MQRKRRGSQINRTDGNGVGRSFSLFLLIILLSISLSACLEIVEESPGENPETGEDLEETPGEGTEMIEEGMGGKSPTDLQQEPVPISPPVETRPDPENGELTSPSEPVEVTEVDQNFPDSADVLEESSLTSEEVIGYFEEKYGPYGGSFVIQVSVGPDTFESEGYLHHQREVFYTLTRKEDDQVIGKEVLRQVYRRVALDPPIAETLEEEYSRVVEEDRIVEEIEAEIVQKLNETREENGLSTLSAASDLTALARIKSIDMGLYDYFNHNSPTYGNPFEMADALGVTLRSENIQWATWDLTAEEVHTNFMDSPGHRDNRMTDTFTEVGIGVMRLESGYYVTELFR